MSKTTIDANALMSGLVGKTILTYTGRPNRILQIRGSEVIVATGRSPQGTPVPIAWVQAGINRLIEDGEVEVSVPSLGYRSAFVGAVLLSIKGARKAVNPTRVIFES